MPLTRILRFLRSPWQNKVNRLGVAVARVKTTLYYRRFFGAIGSGSRIDKPLFLSNPQFVFIGDNTTIRPAARIEIIVLHPSHPPSLRIGNNVNIEQNVHLVCSSSIIIGNNVTITGHCAIVDTVHPFEDVDDPRKIGDRIDLNPRQVSIGDKSFVGFGAVILPGVHIGKNCVVGANSVVTRDVPDYSVVAGCPAVVLKRYNFEQEKWVR